MIARRLAGAVIVLALAAAAGCSRNDAAPKPAPAAVPVVTAIAEMKPAPLTVAAVGNVAPYRSVAVKSRIDGQIVAVHFHDGDEVRDGQLLFELDSRALQAQVAQLEASVARNEALVDNANSQEQRYRDLKKQGFISAEAYTQAQTSAQAAQAALREQQAALKNARIELGYTRIRSPLSGRAGRVLIQNGNVVKANDTTPLVVINQLEPAYIDFSVPESLLGKVRDAVARGKLAALARAPGGGTELAKGDVTFVDNAVDEQTGTIRLRATFSNRDHALWPGQYVEVDIVFDPNATALVIPAAAVQNGPDGQYVWIVNASSRAELRPVKIERTQNGQAIVAGGLKAGDTVVVSGQVRLVPDTAVEAKPAPPA